MHFSPSKYHSCSSQTVGFGVGQVGEVPHDGMSVGDGVTDSVVMDGFGVVTSFVEGEGAGDSSHPS